MEPVSRRDFFKRAGAVATVAAVASTAAVAPIGVASAVAGAATQNQERDLTPSEDLSAGEHLVAHVKNARTGEISLFIGHREVTLHDRKVAARLVRATR